MQENFTRISILGESAILVGQDLTQTIVKETLDITSASSYAIVTDFHVASFGHLDALKSAFESGLKEGNRDARVLSFVIPPGESVKTREMKAVVEDFLLQNRCTRDTCLIALGGGIVGDMCGFVAATFMRGIPVIQVPTTLLAMVDSSIGGKTAVDTPHGKNLIGAFHQPKRIFMDVNYLTTLPRRELVNGLAEVIKTAAIWSETDFEHLENFVENILNVESENKDALCKAILSSAKTKAHVVTIDEKETGLRGLLNFGHTVGHAIEAILAPAMLHGECVAIGMVKEAEIARNLGHLNDSAVGRLVRCLQAYGLPVSLEDGRVPRHCQVAEIMEFMKMDKKNQGSKKKMVLLKSIGSTVEPKASIVDDQVIVNTLSPSVWVQKVSTPFRQNEEMVLQVPGSKSISNRALVLAALGQGECRLQGLLNSDDVQVMLNALQHLVGMRYKWEDNGHILVIEGGQGKLQVPSVELYLGNAGTASRFLTSVCALIQQDGSDSTILTGNQRMKQRPIGPLVDALRTNGCDIDFVENKGCLPLKIKPRGLKGGEIHLSASISSQYVSSILMAAPYAAEPVTLILDGDDVVSQPYIDMTIAMMASFGVQVTKEPNQNVYYIPKQVYKNPVHYQVEADASSATYPLAFAAITGSKVTVSNIGSQSLQGDAQFAIKVLGQMGCQVDQTLTSTTVKGPSRLKPIPSIDMETMTDAFLTASVLAAVACDAHDCKTHIYGIANQRVKECDRIHAMVEQLSRFGVKATECEDGLYVFGVRDLSLLTSPVGGVDCYDDHRVAMSFSLLSAVTGAMVNEKKCVEKTWPGWWDTLEHILGVTLHGRDPAESKSIPPISVNENTLVLIGMRGVGKSHAGKAIAKAFDWQYIDMDTFLEEELNKSIPQVIKEDGWDFFRQQEALLLKKALTYFPKQTVIACGGGIVETEEGRRTLTEWKQKTDNVIYLMRNMKQVCEELNRDTTRPMYGEDMMQVFARRKPWYTACSSAEFTLMPEPWQKAERDLIYFCSHWLGLDVIQPEKMKYFLSLTVPNVALVKDTLKEMVQGVDAVELRVDLLESSECDFVVHQLSLLRRMLLDIDYLPIIFTVRTKEQGGQFEDEPKRMQLIELAMRHGCELIDVEVYPVMTKEYRTLLRQKRKCKIIASYHDVKGEAIWHLPTFAAMSSSGVLGAVQSAANKNLNLHMSQKYQQMAEYGDLVKLVSVAKSEDDNIQLQKFVASLGKPVIAINMGPLGQITRVRNSCLTPVTHGLLPTSAAPGQLTVKEINQCRHLLGLSPKKDFYLFGDPILHSMSPTLHNTAFYTLGLPHEYHLFETSNWESLKAILQQPGFGGASVTIPLKEDVMQLVDQLSPEAQAIGALNTIGKTEDGRLWGDNTDWLGMRACLEKTMCSPLHVGIVLGAGGTAKAACYMLKQQGLANVFIWNRTFSRGQQLAQLFDCRAVEFLSEVFNESLKGKSVCIVNTIPGDIQLPIPPVHAQDVVLIEMVMKPKATWLTRQFSGAKIVYGIDVLLEQGYEQLKRWIQMKPPRQAIESQVMNVYEKKN